VHLSARLWLPWRHIFLSCTCQLSDTDHPSQVWLLVVSWLRWPVVGLSPHRPRLDRMLIDVWLWWTKRHWDRCKSDYFGFPLSLSFHQRPTLVFTYMLLLPERQTDEAWEPSKKLCPFGSRRKLCSTFRTVDNIGQYDLSNCAHHISEYRSHNQAPDLKISKKKCSYIIGYYLKIIKISVVRSTESCALIVRLLQPSEVWNIDL